MSFSEVSNMANSFLPSARSLPSRSMPSMLAFRSAIRLISSATRRFASSSSVSDTRAQCPSPRAHQFLPRSAGAVGKEEYRWPTSVLLRADKVIEERGVLRCHGTQRTRAVIVAVYCDIASLRHSSPRAHVCCRPGAVSLKPTTCAHQGRVVTLTERNAAASTSVPFEPTSLELD